MGQFSLGSFISNTNSELDLFEVHFVISKYLQGSILGVWHLDVKTDNMSQNINISVAVQTYQNISTSIKSSPYTKGKTVNSVYSTYDIIEWTVIRKKRSN